MVEEKFMQRCLDLAKLGAGNVAPNPMVGCVIVLEGKIIGEGFHQKYGEAHAEVNAIHSVSDENLLRLARLYVSLEPCSHFGKTPPCSDLIIEKNIPEIIIGCIDPNPLVGGNGIRKMQAANRKLQVGILEAECRELNKRFFTFIEKNRPYVILKWAQTADHFMAPVNKHRLQISNEYSQTLVHRWRSEEQAIMIGTETALHDNPKLDARKWNGKNPTRIILDRTLRLPQPLEIFQQENFIVFTEKKKEDTSGRYIAIDFSKNIIPQILNELYPLNIQSVLVEGGAQLLHSFIQSGYWDEARIFTNKKFYLNEGIPSPNISGKMIGEFLIDDNELVIFRNQ